MKRQVAIVRESISEGELIGLRQGTLSAGAVIRFLGVVRGTEEGQPILGLEYEAFQPMVEHQFNLIFQQIEQRWPIEEIHLVHRIGFVKSGEPSLWVEILAPHRGEAFAACQFLIDEMKRVVPIWKRPILTANNPEFGSAPVRSQSK